LGTKAPGIRGTTPVRLEKKSVDVATDLKKLASLTLFRYGDILLIPFALITVAFPAEDT
jgi:hypothetical protein